MLKIAQVAPLYESVPPKLYGGTERVVSYLTDELVSQGHDVTLFASGDSASKAHLVPVHHEALRLGKCMDPLAYHILQLQLVMERAQEFDILHFHTDYLHFPLTSGSAYPSVTTLHGRLDLPELQPIYRKFPKCPVVSISYSQRTPIPGAAWVGNVYHGLPERLYRPGEGKGDYVAFIGRISPEKRVDRAIEIAGKAGIRIRIAAKIDKVDQEYFHRKIRHLLKLPHVEYIGEIGEAEKGEFLGNAKALLFPIDWPEPFGMVMIEAMACGTPVIAWDCGSVREVIDEGITGRIVDDIGQAVRALEQIDDFDRAACRDTFEKRFSAGRMARDYVRIYEQLIEEKGKIVSLPSSERMEKRLYPFKKMGGTLKEGPKIA